ncbi:MAG: UDP-glucose 4-epimerase, partial [Bacillota bacterium]
MSHILVTGGAGFIGSHTLVELLNSGHDVIVIDNLSNASKISLERVKEITGKDVLFYEADIRDRAVLDRIFEEHPIDAVIH